MSGPGPLSSGDPFPALIKSRPSSLLSFPTHLVFNVKDALLNFVMDLVGRLDKRLLHVAGSLGGRLHEEQAVVSRKLLTLLLRHGTLGVQVSAKESNVE